MSVKKVLFIGSLLVLVTVMSAGEEYRWYKGQTHCHTLNSDGDQWPRKVVRWYRDHNYNFLVITDHDYITETKYLDTDKNDDFILITGEEVTDEYGDKPVHLNAIGIKRLVNPQRGESIIDTLQNNADAIVEAGGIAQVNHPHYQWAFGAKELAALKGVKLFEVYNLNHDCNNFAAGGEPGMETVWDRVPRVN
jgi:predicted metal-dependent phosphoesterase TrpH